MACNKFSMQKILMMLAATLLVMACSGGSTTDGSKPFNPIYTLNCLERYEKIEENMNESQVVAILDKPTYVTKVDGNLLGAGWSDVVYAGQRCALIIGFDKKGVYTKGITDMTGRNSDFEPRFQNFRVDQGF